MVRLYNKMDCISFDPGDDFSCENHEFSSPGNSVSCPVTENPILLEQTFQLLERKLNLSTWKFMSTSWRKWRNIKKTCKLF